MIETIFSFITSLVQNFGYLGIFVSLFLNSNFVSIYTEVVLPFAGFLASQGELSVPLIILVAVLGDLAGATFNYKIGHLLNENLILKWINKYGRFLFIREKEYLRVTSWINKHGLPIIFAVKLTPMLKSTSSLVSGISKVKFSKFILVVLGSSIVYNTFWTLLGFYLGQDWKVLGKYFEEFGPFVLLMVFMGTILYLNYKLKFIKLKKS